MTEEEEQQLYKDFQNCYTIFNEKIKDKTDNEVVNIILEQITGLDETNIKNRNYLFLLKNELIKKSIKYKLRKNTPITER
jgi:hypothetical protein